MNTLELKNVSYSFRNKEVFRKINIKIKKNKNVSIVANTGGGKTILSLIFKNKLQTDGEYLINGVEVVKSNAYVVDRFVNVLTIDNNDNNTKVIDLLFDQFDDLEEDEQQKEVNKVSKYFSIGNYLNNKLKDLPDDIKYYVLIITNLLKKDIFLIIDNLLCYLTKDEIKKVYSYAKKNKVTVVDITSRLDDIFNSDYVYFIYDKGIAMEGDIISCLKEEKLIKRMGYKLPFMFDLCLQLNYYEVLDNIYLDRDEMIDKVWK